MRRYAIIVGGGSGSRMGGGIPKQFRSICGRPMIWWAMKAFYDENPATEIILVLPENFISLWNDFFTSLPEQDRIIHRVTAGGTTRTESVKNGLKLVKDKDATVAVHDGARPMLKKDLICRGWSAVEETGAAIPIVEVVDSLREINGKDSNAVDRSKFRAVQTPQVFLATILKNAYEENRGIFTDDAAAVESSGIKITLYDGDPDNLKVTTPKDMVIAEMLLREHA